MWNLFVAESAERYKAEGKFVFYAEMSARLPKLLKEDPRLAGLPHRAAQMTVQKLDRALRDCAKSKGKARRGFPRFKKYADRSDAFSFVGREVRIEPGRIRLPIKPLRQQLTNNLLQRLDGKWIRMRKDGYGYVSRHRRVRNGHQVQWFYRVSDIAMRWQS